MLVGKVTRRKKKKEEERKEGKASSSLLGTHALRTYERIISFSSYCPKKSRYFHFHSRAFFLELRGERIEMQSKQRKKKKRAAVAPLKNNGQILVHYGDNKVLTYDLVSIHYRLDPKTGVALCTFEHETRTTNINPNNLAQVP